MVNCAYFVARILGAVMANNLFNAIRVAHRSPTAILALLVDSYTADYRTFATGNNRAPLEEAVKILTGSKLDKALALAISKGYDAGGLTTGYIGAVSGKYAAQPPEVQAKYDGAIEKATSAFRVALTDSGLFAEKEEKSKAQKEEEKAKKEEEKAKKEAEAKAAILHAAVISGEVVRAADIVPAPDTHEMASIVCNSIIAGLLTEDELEMLRVALSIVAPVAPVADTVPDTVSA
jgi:septum formation inhibitor MinC